VQTNSGASPVTAIRASLAAPKAPPCSPTVERCSGTFNAAAMMPVHTWEREPPPITAAASTCVPEASSTSRQSRSEKATPSSTACEKASVGVVGQPGKGAADCRVVMGGSFTAEIRQEQCGAWGSRHINLCQSVSVSARGLTGDANFGHVFWDTEIYLLPFYTAVWPEAGSRWRRDEHSARDMRARLWDRQRAAWHRPPTSCAEPTRYGGQTHAGRRGHVTDRRRRACRRHEARAKKRSSNFRR
jgi:glycosyl hydrolase family 65